MQRLSIIVPVLDEAAGIADTLRQFDAARSAGHELVVVDGGSRDETVERARPWCDVLTSSERGRARQLAQGVRVASGDIFWFVHADTGLAPSLFKSVTSAVERGHAWGRFDVRLSGSHPMFRVIERMINLRSRLTKIATGDQGIFVTRRTLESVGGIPLQDLLEDVELCRRLKRYADSACLREKITTSSRRWESHGIWRTIVLMWWLRWRYFLGADPVRLHERYYGRS
jgi:rSAM/selenodomain-associated transferase 2